VLRVTSSSGDLQNAGADANTAHKEPLSGNQTQVNKAGEVEEAVDGPDGVKDSSLQRSSKDTVVHRLSIEALSELEAAPAGPELRPESFEIPVRACERPRGRGSGEVDSAGVSPIYAWQQSSDHAGSLDGPMSPSSCDYHENHSGKEIQDLELGSNSPISARTSPLALSVLVDIFHRCALQDGGALNAWSFRDALLSSSSVFFTSRPVTVAATKPVFQGGAILLGLYFLYWSYAGYCEVAFNGIIQPNPRGLKLSVLSLRDTNADPAHPNPFSFGTLRDGCPSEFTTISNGHIANIKSNSSLSVNGYSLFIEGWDPALDPVRWSVETTDERGNVLRLVGASMWRGQGSLSVFYSNMPYPVPEHDRNHGNEVMPLQILIDLRPAWPWVLTDVGIYLISGVGWISYACSGHSKRQRTAVRVLSGMFGANMVFEFAALSGWLALGNWKQAAISFIRALADGTMASTVGLREERVIIMLTSFSIFNILAMVAQEAYFYHGSSLVDSIMFSSGFLSLVFCFVVFSSYRIALGRARNLVLADRSKYDAAWSAALAEQNVLNDLCMKVKIISLTCPKGTLRHLNRLRVSSSLVAHARAGRTGLGGGSSSRYGDSARVADGNPAEVCGHGSSIFYWLTRGWKADVDISNCGSRGSVTRAGNKHRDSAGARLSSGELLLECGIPDQLDYGAPVHSLDQLYYQAIALNPILISKIQQWASLSSGFFLASHVSHRASETTRGHAGYMEHSPEGNNPAETRRWRMSQPNVLERTQPEYIQWVGARGGWTPTEEYEQLTKVKWSRVKSVRRSIEKATRSYKKDVSRLVDICRQSIYFERMEHLLQCLHVMSADSDVCIMRLKNRFDPDLDTASSAGFRNLAINLRIRTSQAMDLALEAHVCEVQLLLATMASIKNDNGHKRYIDFRNLRGE